MNEKRRIVSYEMVKKVLEFHDIETLECVEPSIFGTKTVSVTCEEILGFINYLMEDRKKLKEKLKNFQNYYLEQNSTIYKIEEESKESDIYE